MTSPNTLPPSDLSATALALAQTLVRMNTVSRNSNLELIHFVRDTLKKSGVDSRLTWNADKTKANLFATRLLRFTWRSAMTRRSAVSACGSWWLT